jgi:hypothetical protein
MVLNAIGTLKKKEKKSGPKLVYKFFLRFSSSGFHLLGSSVFTSGLTSRRKDNAIYLRVCPFSIPMASQDSMKPIGQLA